MISGWHRTRSAGKVRDLVGESAVVVDGHDHTHAVVFADALVVLAETWGAVHDAGALIGLHEIVAEHPEAVQIGPVGEVWEQRRVRAADEFGSRSFRSVPDRPVFSDANSGRTYRYVVIESVEAVLDVRPDDRDPDSMAASMVWSSRPAS